MKRIAPIGLLLLLLYNTFGLSIAILFFQNDYRDASATSAGDDWLVIKTYLPTLPYSDNLEISGELEGLIRHGDEFYNPTQVHHEDDTLYVTLKSNQAARDRFFELANAIETLTQPDLNTPGTDHGKALKILNSLLKNYLPVQQHTFNSTNNVFVANSPTNYNALISHYIAQEIQLSSPPPEHV